MRCHYITSFLLSLTSLNQATLREANRLLADQGAPPLVDIGGIVNQEAAAIVAAARQSTADTTHADVPQPVHAGAKKVAVAPAAPVPSKGPAAASGAGKFPQVEVRAKTPQSTFLTGVGMDADDDELAKASVQSKCRFAANQTDIQRRSSRSDMN